MAQQYLEVGSAKKGETTHRVAGVMYKVRTFHETVDYEAHDTFKPVIAEDQDKTHVWPHEIARVRALVASGRRCHQTLHNRNSLWHERARLAASIGDVWWSVRPCGGEKRRRAAMRYVAFVLLSMAFRQEKLRKHHLLVLLSALTRGCNSAVTPKINFGCIADTWTLMQYHIFVAHVKFESVRDFKIIIFRFEAEWVSKASKRENASSRVRVLWLAMVAPENRNEISSYQQSTSWIEGRVYPSTFSPQ